MTPPVAASIAGQVVAALLLGSAAALLIGPRTAISRGGLGADRVDRAATPPETDRMRRHRPVLSLFAGIGAALLVGGPIGPVAALAGAAGCWVVIGRAEPAGVRREREALRRELPQVVRLLAGALAAGGAPGESIEIVAAAMPGPAAERLAAVAARLRLGADPVAVWQGLTQDPALAPLGRALARAQVSGSSVVASVERLADELGRAARADVEDRARRVGVKAAVPLGLCLLPAFVLVGIVPLVGGLVAGLGL